MIKDRLQSFFKKASPFLLSWRSAFVAFLVFLSFGSNVLFLFYPEKGKKWASFIFYQKPIKNLSRVEFSPHGDGPKFRVIKLKKKNKIYLEILSERADKSFHRVEFLELAGNREAYFDYWGEAISLFVLDYDGDGQLDIGTATFDSFFRAQFQRLIYNKETQSFKLQTLKQLPSIEQRVN